MNRKIICRDFSRNKVVSLTTVLFITAAAMLLSLTGILTVNLFTSIDQLMEDAKTPHFMQMHSGTADMELLESFADENSSVEEFQVLEFLNVDSAKIQIGENSLAGNVQDNGFSTQSREFDFLLDMDNKPVYPEDGELFVPVCYYRDKTARVGDRAVIGGKIFTVAGFIRDSQMNSTLASSKRFLISVHDYEQLKASGTVEYLIEFRLNDLSELNGFEAAYRAAELPSNGASLTWPLFRMISAVSDGIMIAVILLVSILVILIALLCIRFTLLAKIEDDYREIGVMKAVGLRVSDIRRIYLGIYASLTGAGCAAGYLLSLVFRNPLQESIRLNFGSAGDDGSALFLGMAGDLILFFFILFCVSRILQKFSRITAAQAVRFQAGGDAAHSTGKFRLSENRWFNTNLFLGIKDIFARKRLYITMLLVAVLACFIMVVPQNLYHTISDRNFVTYMGIGRCDLRVDIQQTDQINKRAAEIGRYMAADPKIDKYAVLTAEIFSLKLEDGTVENIKTELGDHGVFPVQYTEGGFPSSDQDIALSVLYAEELGKGVGDSITLFTDAGERMLTVCGIYSDITNGGKTAKAAFKGSEKEAVWGTVCADTGDKSLLSEIVTEYESRFAYAKVSDIDEYVAQTFGQTLSSVKAASIAAGMIASAVTLLVTLLFMKLLISKDRYAIAVMKAVGFTGSDITRQYIWRAAAVMITGIFIGTVLAGTLGERLAGAAVASFGAASFRFTVNPLSTFLLSPAILLMISMAATISGTGKAGMILVSEYVKE